MQKKKKRRLENNSNVIKHKDLGGGGGEREKNMKNAYFITRMRCRKTPRNEEGDLTIFHLYLIFRCHDEGINADISHLISLRVIKKHSSSFQAICMFCIDVVVFSHLSIACIYSFSARPVGCWCKCINTSDVDAENW